MYLLLSFIDVTSIQIIAICVCFLFSPAPMHPPVKFESNKIEAEAPLQISMVIITRLLSISLYSSLIQSFNMIVFE